MRLIYVVILSFSLNVMALDSDEQKGLSQTTDLLKSSKDRQKVIDADPSARDVDAKVSALAGSGKNKEEIYGVSAEVFDKVVKEANGDPQKLQNIMDEAAKNPEAFYSKYFGDAQKAKVRDVANKIDANKPAMGPQK